MAEADTPPGDTAGKPTANYRACLAHVGAGSPYTHLEGTPADGYLESEGGNPVAHT